MGVKSPPLSNKRFMHHQYSQINTPKDNSSSFASGESSSITVEIVPKKSRFKEISISTLGPLDDPQDKRPTRMQDQGHPDFNIFAT